MRKTAAYRLSRSPIALAAALCLSLGDCAWLASLAEDGSADSRILAETGSAGAEQYWDPDKGMISKPSSGRKGEPASSGGNSAAMPAPADRSGSAGAPPALKPDKTVKMAKPVKSEASPLAAAKEVNTPSKEAAKPSKEAAKPVKTQANPVAGGKGVKSAEKSDPAPKTTIHQKTTDDPFGPSSTTIDDGFELKSQTPKMAPVGAATAKPAPQPQAKNDAAAASTTAKKDEVSKPAGEDHYPSVARMEDLTFGASHSDLAIDQRLGSLEQAVFQKTFADQSLFDRTEKLKKTLLGSEDDTQSRESELLRSASSVPLIPFAQGNSVDSDYFESLAQRPENQERVPKESLKTFALEAINFERGKLGMPPVELDDIACKVAQDQVDEMCKRNVITHSNMKGDNPDRRYTIAGGNGALTESIVSNKTPDTVSQSPTKSAVIYILKTIMSRQDDHDALFNPDATQVGFAIDWTAAKDKVIAATEVVTKHGIIHPLPLETRVGEKVEIKGVVLEPYKFERVTLAWEASHDGASVADDSEEALPYFPPLDYAAYAAKSEHDYSTTMGALRTVGIIAAIAGGMFIPPVALAAPLIAMSGGMGEPKPVSDIPVHGGMKLEGSTFSGKIALNKEGKEGIYYVTVWASTGKYAKPIPISRQAIIARSSTEDVSASVEPAGHEKKSKKVKQASAQP